LVLKNLERENIFAETLDEIGWKVNYSTEADIRAKVSLFIRDALRTLGLQFDVTISNESQIRKGGKADIWIIKTISGRPLAVCEVKCPSEHRNQHGEVEMNLRDSNVMGQLFDYMVELRSMFGQCEVFGILTNLEEWTFCWFPDTNAYAASDSLGNPPTQTKDNYLLKSHLLVNRILSTSRRFLIKDGELPCALLSVLMKSFHAQFRTVPLLSTERVYLTYTDKTYLWETLSGLESLTIQLRMPKANTKSFKVLRYFHGGATGTVVLALTNALHLVVVKMHSNEEQAQREQAAWSQLYDRTDAFVTPLCADMSTTWGVVMPFVLHASTPTPVSIQTSLSTWSKEEVATAEPSPLFDTWSSQFAHALNTLSLDVPSIANMAILHVAEKGFIHNDLKWAHVAVMPILDGDGGVEILQPVLIDLASIQESTNAKDAYLRMKTALDELCDDIGVQHQPNLIE
jgi:hypothetical protein